MELFEIKVNDLTISYLTNEVAQPELTVLFIHGFPFNKSIWQNQLDNLPENIQGIAYDVRGHGDTSGGHRFFSVDLFARDLIAFVNVLDLKSVMLCGISMGGYIALRAFERSPAYFAGLILCDTTSLPDTNQVKLARFDGIEAIIKDGKETYAASFVKKLFSPENRNIPAVSDFIKGTIIANDENNICSALLALASRTDTTDMLADIKVPCVVIRGEHDQIISNEQAVQLHRNIVDSEFQVISASGHLPNVENADVFNRVVADFLNRHFSARR